MVREVGGSTICAQAPWVTRQQHTFRHDVRQRLRYGDAHSNPVQHGWQRPRSTPRPVWHCPWPPHRLPAPTHPRPHPPIHGTPAGGASWVAVAPASTEDQRAGAWVWVWVPGAHRPRRWPGPLGRCSGLRLAIPSWPTAPAAATIRAPAPLPAGAADAPPTCTLADWRAAAHVLGPLRCTAKGQPSRARQGAQGACTPIRATADAHPAFMGLVKGAWEGCFWARWPL